MANTPTVTPISNRRIALRWNRYFYHWLPFPAKIFPGLDKIGFNLWECVWIWMSSITCGGWRKNWEWLLLAAEDESHSLDQKESWVGGSWSGWREGAANTNLVGVAWRPPWWQKTSPMWKKSPAWLTRKPRVWAVSLLWHLHTVLGNLTVAELFVFSIPLCSSEKMFRYARYIDILSPMNMYCLLNLKNILNHMKKRL